MNSPTASRLTLSSFWRDLPREGRLLLTVVVFEFIGTGLVMPFNVVYLHEVRGFALSDVGLLLALPPLVGFAVVGPGGLAIDRYGARRILIGSLVLLVLGDLTLLAASTLPLAATGLVLSGVGFGVSWPASQSFIATIVPSELRQRYFGINFTLLNLGIGLGGLIGGFVVDVERLVTFQWMYLGDAISYLLPLFLLLVPLSHTGGPPPPHESEHATASYLEVLRRPAVLSLLVVGFLAAFVGYSQLNVGMPAFARAVSQISTQGLGLAFAANTLVIVLLQLLVLGWIEGHRRTRVVAVMGATWALSWLLLGLSGLVPGTLGATLLVAAFAGVFGLGETLLQPTLPAIVNDLAPDHLRGRYNALGSGGFQFAAIIAPAITGALIDHGHATSYIVALVVGSLLVGVFAVLRLEPQLSDEVNGIRRTPVSSD